MDAPFASRDILEVLDRGDVNPAPIDAGGFKGMIQDALPATSARSLSALVVGVAPIPGPIGDACVLTSGRSCCSG